MKSKSRFGSFFFLAVPLWLALSSVPGHCEEIQVPAEEWQSFKASFMRLKRHNESLQMQLPELITRSEELENQLKLALIELETGHTLLRESELQLKAVLNQAERLEKQLMRSEDSLNELKSTTRTNKVKAYVVGFGLGILAGCLIGAGLAWGI